ncbi:hypothetical protein SAMN04515648_3382 [Phyllobacterium sp. CL33Tsu]|uniref:hypothetical protein n=1 Tax=Phyllobacterium sp. CL33Tsu TaxID=1798191 RepID=UPI0008DFF20C|nr:hypothetical protein [Phyllobacterium sp. CL33Tsu]SFJ27735.1 hypothetical protein SAMN04515648_3382 [Phyllobacterium sp. CL33Tsu]
MKPATIAPIVPADFPQLKQLAWNRDVARAIPAQEAFEIYERNWRFIDTDKLTGPEADLIKDLTDTFGNGVLLNS